MLSYQHGFHAGNVSDVLKHAVLCSVLDYMAQKDKPLYFHDVHAGRGFYDLTHPVAQKTSEYRDGISALWQATSMPVGLQPYLQTLRLFNVNGSLRFYAGSLLLAQKLLTQKHKREQDRFFASELHPQEYSALCENTQSLVNMRVQKVDGYAALKAALPPKERRAVVLIDPSYETQSDDAAVVDALNEALKRFSTGVYLLWYPIVDAQRTKKMIKKIAALPLKNLLQVELLVREPTGVGMAGSGMLVINPPWSLAAAMQETLPWLVQQLAPSSGSYRVVSLVAED